MRMLPAAKAHPEVEAQMSWQVRSSPPFPRAVETCRGGVGTCHFRPI